MNSSNNSNIYSNYRHNSLNSSSHTLDPKQQNKNNLTSSDGSHSFIYRSSSPLPNSRLDTTPLLDTKALKPQRINDTKIPSSAGSEFDTDDDIINHYVSSPDRENGSPLEVKLKAQKISEIIEEPDSHSGRTDSNSRATDDYADIVKQRFISPRVSDINTFLAESYTGKRMSSSTSNPISVTSDVTPQAATPHVSSNELPLSENFRKEQDEWAEKGAAKIVQMVKNEKTGEVSKKIVSRGIKDFKFGTEIGDGSFSRVLLATSVHDDKEKYAIKILSKSYLVKQNKVKYVNIEKMALQRLSDLPTVVKMFFTFQDQNSLYFVLEYAPNGDFLSVMKEYGSLSEDCTRYYSAQIIDAIGDLHEAGIIHRDIKPENILLDKEKKIKLTDFGTAKILERGENDAYDLFSRSKSFVGTAEYVSPELLNDSYTDYKCDIWAFGCILFQMVAGKPPFKATNEYLTFQKVQKIQYAFTAGFPTIIRDLVKRILIKSPEKRLEISEIKNHFFYKEIDFNTIWLQPPPPIQPYRMNAKSMAPIPELSSQPLSSGQKVLRRPTAPVSVATTSSISSDSSRAKSSPSIATPSPTSSKKVVDSRTKDILDQANKRVRERKLNKLNYQKNALNNTGNESKNAAMIAMSSLKPSASAISSRNVTERTTSKRSKTSSSKATSLSNSGKGKTVPKSRSSGSHTDSLSINISKALENYLLPGEKVKKTDVLDAIFIPTSTLNTLLAKKATTLSDLALFENLPHYNTKGSSRVHKSINKALVLFDVPDN